MANRVLLGTDNAGDITFNVSKPGTSALNPNLPHLIKGNQQPFAVHQRGWVGPFSGAGNNVPFQSLGYVPAGHVMMHQSGGYKRLPFYAAFVDLPNGIETQGFDFEMHQDRIVINVAAEQGSQFFTYVVFKNLVQ